MSNVAKPLHITNEWPVDTAERRYLSLGMAGLSRGSSLANREIWHRPVTDKMQYGLLSTRNCDTIKGL
jgi:hypothetical protein